jgi:P pilus assembly chaperone PapD
LKEDGRRKTEDRSRKTRNFRLQTSDFQHLTNIFKQIYSNMLYQKKLQTMSLSRSLLLRNLQTFIRTNFRFSSLFVLIALTILVPFKAVAQGNLLITPRRVVFDGTKRSVDLNLANIGKDTATYAISLVQIRMKEDGSFETVTSPDPGQNFADKNLRFFPRIVTLPPNAAQVVKVQLLKANQLAPGEYRSHIYFRAVPKVNPLGEEETVTDTTTISVRLTPVFGITIPAIIRIGESSAKVSLSELKLENAGNGTPNLSLTFNRTGNFSVYGDLTVDHVSPQGKVTRVGVANGIAVYTPNLIRHFQFSLNKVQGVDFSTGKLLVIFSAPSDVKPARYAEAELSLR